MYNLSKDELLEILDIDDEYVIDDRLLYSINDLLNCAYHDGWCECYDTYEYDIMRIDDDYYDD